ncbi:hypothetical protein SELMODRAFT_271529 [Selaginella moellendorffii]|uniref:NADP-dependent oxidoreductase domain-containing protein n=1 Tax=Selaginella moellendorffii TaxID=88036 RepID=D8SFF8_SELML|nr:hypothetical protein SELMODRAFT_271529 [Selaginella moellendorffii]
MALSPWLPAARIKTRRHGSSISACITVTTPTQKVRLGKSSVEVSPVGIGAWSWGDTSYWNEGTWNDRKLRDAKEAFTASVESGLDFFDTAEVYGSKFASGAVNSETLLGRFIKEIKQEEQSKIVVATKFAALPWRFGRGSVVKALKDSLERLNLSSVDLYQLHWPGIWGNEGYLDGLGDAVEQGLVKAVGVSNYKVDRLKRSHDQLKRRGVVLASNQVNYSLIYRKPEENSVKQACDDLGITLIAYSPIAQGILSGKYTPSNPPKGPRGGIYNAGFLSKLSPVLIKLKQLGEKYDKTSTQVALNWLVAQKNVVPIPGAKSAQQAIEIAGALGWNLTADEVEELRDIAKRVSPVVGFPVENL